MTLYLKWIFKVNFGSSCLGETSETFQKTEEMIPINQSKNQKIPGVGMGSQNHHKHPNKRVLMVNG